MPFAPQRAQARADDDDPLAQLLAPLSGVLGTARKHRRDAGREGRRDCGAIPAKAVALADQGGALTAEIAKLALMPQDSPTRFKGTPGVAKRVAWADPLPLAEVKAIGKALGASVNDVLLSCVAGALRGYLVDKGDDVDGVMLRALVPVNLRPLEKAYKLGNQFGLVFLDLPIGIENPVERLYAVRANMNALKGIVPAGAGARPARGDGRRAEGAAGRAARGARAQRDGVMTNVPGPAAAALPRRRGDRQPDVLGAAVGRHRHGRVDHLVQRRGAVRRDHRRGPVPRSRARQRALRARVREARADDADGAVAARAAISIRRKRRRRCA